MESLFASRKPKRGLVGLMLAGSLVLHGGLVGVASLWVAAPPPDRSVEIDIIPAPSGEPDVLDPRVLQPSTPTETPVATATPEAIEQVVIPPPVSEEPDFALPPEATPPPHRTTAVRPTVSVNRPPGNPTVSRNPSTGPTGGTPGMGNPSGASAWAMPRPPYPRTLGKAPGTGQTTVRITTDASGRVSNAVIVRSTGNPVLDNHTLSYVRNNWHGPPNASRTTEFVYELR